MALGLTLGIILAVTGGNTTKIAESALGNCASPSASASAAAAAAASAAPAASASASAAPCPSASASASAAAKTVPPAASHANGPLAFWQLGDVANAPVDGAAGAAINLNQNADQAAASMNCTIQVPANPLSAQGLATPWQLGDGCSMANAATEGAFVEATILAPNGSLQVYDPLVITAGTTPAVNPTPPTIARGSQVIIQVGFNGTNLALTGQGALQGRCVDALGQSLIGQESACNAVNFFNLANFEIARGILKVPPVGTSQDGKACLTTRDFGTIDQDQSDNVISQYLINGNGQTAQATAANMAAMNGSTVLTNGSDAGLLAKFLDPANGCTPFTAPNPTNPNGASGSEALNELSARVNQQGTIAVVPPNDPMVLVNGQMSVAKTNVYRSLMDQPLLVGNVNATQVATDYCQNMINMQPARNQLDMARELNFASPVPAVGNNLATFLGARLSASFTNLNCGNFGFTNPVNVTLDGNGVATAVTYNLNQQTPAQAAQAPGPQQGQNPVTHNRFMRRHRHHSAGV
jgi:hypothetical protein